MNELLWFAMLAANFVAILVCYRLFGKIGLFVWIPISVIIANIQVLKTIELFGLSATLGNIVYATSFLATDILSENYGTKAARKAVFAGFFTLLAMILFMNLALFFEPAAEDFAQPHLKALFSLMPRIAGASLLAYGVSQFHDIWAYRFWKRRFPRHIWVRNNASTMVSQLIDSVVFTLVAFAGTFPASVMLEIIVSTYLLKVLVAAADTPFIYLARRWKNRGVIKESDSSIASS